MDGQNKDVWHGKELPVLKQKKKHTVESLNFIRANLRGLGGGLLIRSKGGGVVNIVDASVFIFSNKLNEF